MDFDRALREPELHEQMLYPVTVVSLEHYQAVFCCAAASTVSLQLRAKIAKVNALRVYAFNNCGGFTPFSSLKADLDKLLLHANGSADTEILRKPTGGAYVRHNFVLLLLVSSPDIASVQYLSVSLNAEDFINQKQPAKDNLLTRQPSKVSGPNGKS